MCLLCKWTNSGHYAPIKDGETIVSCKISIGDTNSEKLEQVDFPHLSLTSILILLWVGSVCKCQVTAVENMLNSMLASSVDDHL